MDTFVSLIIGTLNRAEYLSYCLESIRLQSYSHFEVIIIDQSTNNETQTLVENLNWNQIIYKRVQYKGLSKARNDAISCASGEVYCLIDDDAYYDKDYLKNVVTHLQGDSRLVLSGALWNAKTQKSFVDYSKLKNGKSLSYWSVSRYCPSPAISFTKDLITEVGLFDEFFGVGAKYGAAEETDLLFRAKKKGFKVVHYDDISAQHPHERVEGTGEAEPGKTYGYSYGIGAMYKKNTQGKYFSPIGMVYLERVLRDIIKGFINKEDWNLYRNLTQGYKDYHVE